MSTYDYNDGLLGHTRTVESAPLTNWQPVHDDYEGGWLIQHYVGGEDGWIAKGDYATRAEAEAAADKANADGYTHTHHIDL